MRKVQRQQGGVALRPMRRFAARPSQVALALVVEKQLQLIGGVEAAEHGFLAAAHMEIHQRHIDLRQLPRLAQQMRIDLGLGPVQSAVVGAYAVQRAAIGFDFFQPAGCCIKAIGPTLNPQAQVLPAEADFRLVARSAAAAHRGMAFHTFQRSGRRREAQVQIAAAGREFAQSANADHGWRAAVIGGFSAQAPSAGSPSLHCTWQTLTGSPWSVQYASQRIWLSCSLSPGALTSTSS